MRYRRGPDFLFCIPVPQMFVPSGIPPQGFRGLSYNRVKEEARGEVNFKIPPRQSACQPRSRGFWNRTLQTSTVPRESIVKRPTVLSRTSLFERRTARTMSPRSDEKKYAFSVALPTEKLFWIKCQPDWCTEAIPFQGSQKPKGAMVGVLSQARQVCVCRLWCRTRCTWESTPTKAKPLVPPHGDSLLVQQPEKSC